MAQTTDIALLATEPTTDHNRAIVIKALTNDLKVKTLTIYYNSEDSWNDHSMFASMEFLHANCVKAVLNDKTVLGYKSFFCNINPDHSLTKRMETEPQVTPYFQTS